MKCPKCTKEMQEVRQEVTSNLKTGSDLQEYDKVTYQCQEDDIWVTVEVPINTNPSKNIKK